MIEDSKDGKDPRLEDAEASFTSAYEELKRCRRNVKVAYEGTPGGLRLMYLERQCQASWARVEAVRAKLQQEHLEAEMERLRAIAEEQGWEVE